MQPFTSWSFFWHCLDRAATDAAKFFGWDLKTGITTIGLLVVGFLLHLRIKGISATREELSKFFIITAAPLFIFLTALILYNVFRAPYLIYSDERIRAKKDFDAMKRRAQIAETAEAQADETIDMLKKTISQGQTTAKPAATKGSSNAEVERLQHELDQRDARKKTRTSIATLLEQGNALARLCLTMQERPELAAQAEDWAKRAYNYLGAVDPSDAARFAGSSGPSYSHAGVLPANDNVWNFVNVRNQTLAAILSELHD